jgi:hypothetical protein
MGGPELVLHRPYRLQVIAAIFIRELMAAKVIAGIIIMAVAIGMPEIEPGAGYRLAVLVQDAPLDNQLFTRGARPSDILTLWRTGLIIRPFFDTRGQLQFTGSSALFR